MVGCKSNQQKAGMAESNAKPTVTVTIPPYQYFVDKIAGDKVDVNVMVSNGNNPETYEPNAQQMMELSNSALYLKVGSIGFEQTWMKKLQDNAPDMKAKNPIQAPLPAMKRSALSKLSFFTCRYFSIHSILPILPTP